MWYAVSGHVERTQVTGKSSELVKTELERFFVDADNPSDAAKKANAVVNTCGHQNAIHLVLTPVDAVVEEVAA